ncbi:hypothetical protein BKI52_14910 [marine bacterium AO1-C]|nr:hypothetical protein BKI52_14910 [marine bacterium AO1-C]
MTKNYTFVSLLALIGMMMMASCGEKGSSTTTEIPADFRDAKMTKTGILYKFISHNEDTAKAFRFDKAIDFKMIVKNHKDSLVDARFQNKPLEHYIYQPPRFQGDPNEILAMCAEGDSIMFAVPVDSLVANRRIRPSAMFPQGTYMKHYVKVIRVKPAAEAKKALQAMQKLRDSLARKRQDSLAQVQIKVNKEDSITIRKYVKDNNLTGKAKFTKSGLCYIITKEGDGPMPQQYDSVSTNYVGRLLNGNLFDTSVEEIARKENTFQEGRPYGPFTFMIGVGRVIKAWDEGLALLKKGGKATLIAPSKLAYGPQSRGKVIKANSILMFDVELTDVKKGSIPKNQPMPKMPQGHSKGDGHNH